MPINKDTGHDKNVLNLELLASECDLIGPNYQPINPDLLLSSLLSLHETSDASLVALAEAVKRTNRATNERELGYELVNPLVTRLLNSLKSTKAAKNNIEDAKTLADKIRGHKSKGARAKQKGTLEGAEEVKTVSTSEQSYDNRAKNFALLVSLLESEPAYAPLEADLTVASLKALAKQLKDWNTTVAKAEAEEAKVRTQRNQLLYAPEVGLVDIGNKSKSYILSLFSASSPQYKRISKIKFVKLS